MDLTTHEQITELTNRIVKLLPVSLQTDIVTERIRRTINEFAGAPREFRPKSLYETLCSCGRVISSHAREGRCACGRFFRIG